MFASHWPKLPLGAVAAAVDETVRHVIVSGVPDALDAQDAIAKGIAYEIAQDPPPLTGRPSVARFEGVARFMRRFDLVLTYNWGAIDGVMAARAFPKGAPPVVHHEDGFNADEAGGLKVQRNVYRRIALGVHRHDFAADALEQFRGEGARRAVAAGRDDLELLLQREFAGQIVEMNEPQEFFLNPQHERTKLFLSQILKH